MTQQRKYGWVPDRVNWQDHYYAVAAPTHVDHVDRIGMDVAIDDQGQCGSCTGNSTTAAIEIVTKSPPLSRLMAYFLGRVPEATQDVDAGAMISDVIAGIQQYGIAQESLWPYDVTKFAERPSLDAFADARSLPPKIKAYQRVPSLAALKNALVAGLPVVFGFSVPEYFESDAVAATGWVRVPYQTDRMIGGHAVVAVGYDDRTATPFIWVRNSWGLGWGVNGSGYFQMDQRWFSDPRRLTDDMWAILPA